MAPGRVSFALEGFASAKPVWVFSLSKDSLLPSQSGVSTFYSFYATRLCHRGLRLLTVAGSCHGHCPRKRLRKDEFPALHEPPNSGMDFVHFELVESTCDEMLRRSGKHLQRFLDLSYDRPYPVVTCNEHHPYMQCTRTPTAPSCRRVPFHSHYFG